MKKVFFITAFLLLWSSISYFAPQEEKNKLIAATDTGLLLNDANKSWFQQAVKQIRNNEYTIKKNNHSGVYSSPNRMQGLRSEFSGSYFSLSPRKDSCENWNLSLTVKGIFSGNKKLFSTSLHPQVTHKENELLFNHGNEFATEYINSKEGIRQNFIIYKKPNALHQNISVKLEANKGWVLNQPHKKEIHFAKQEGNTLVKKITYNSLHVWDAIGKELDAYFTVAGNEINIEVNTTGATYPVTIDPLSTGTTGTIDWQVSDANQAGAEFGVAVSSAGDINGDGYSDVIVGAYLYDDGFTDEGAAFVYHGSASGLSTTPNAVLSDGNQNAALYGQSVNTAGDVNGDGYSDIIVGCYFYDDGGNTNEGAAFVYHGSATGISGTPNSILDDANQADAQNGRGVACAGDVNGDGYSDVIVGAWSYDDGANSSEGRAYIYHGSATGLAASPNSVIDDADQASAFLGNSVNCAGDVNGDGYSDVIVSAHNCTDGGNAGEGRTYVYHGSATGIGTSPNSIQDDANQAGAAFGYSAAGAGDVNGDGYSDIVVGALNYNGTTTDEGAAFIYFGSASGINASPNITTEPANQVDARYGWSVACAGDVNADGYSDVIISAPVFDDGANTNEGRVYIYYGLASGTSTTPDITLEDANQASCIFGAYVTSAGDVNGDGLSDVIIGAWGYDDGSNTNEGRSYVYYGSYTGLSTTVNATRESNQAFALYGSSVHTAGDINSDGYSDVIIGAPQYDNGNTDEGAAFVFYGSAAGLPASPSWTTEGNQDGASYGRTVTGIGDVNGDGYGDVAVAANLYDGTFTDGGRVFIYHGSAGGLSTTASRTIDGPQASSAFGYAVSYAGDVNGDGYSDMIIGAWGIDDVSLTDKGMAYVYHGSATGIPATASWAYDHGMDGATVGESVAGAGDVNGDGYSDVIVGATYFSNGQSAEGAAFIFHGSPIGLSSTPNRIYESNQANAAFSVSVNSAGDVNGDGFSDVIIGARLFDGPSADVGRVFIYHGSSTGLAATANRTINGDQASSFFGQAAASAGDINGDGYSDIFIGAYWYDNGQSNEGRSYLHLGSSSGIVATSSWNTEGNLASAQYGQVIAPAGDINGDGFSDVIVGAPNFTNGETNEGRVYIFYGNSLGGLRNNIRLYNPDLVTPIQQINVNPNLFGAGFFAKSPLGRQSARMVWDTKGHGLSFLGSPINTTTLYRDRQVSFTDLGITGTELKSQIAKENFQTKIRTRVEYNKTTAFTGQVYGPWRYPPGYTQGFHGMNAVPLPFTLLSFTANRKNDGAVLIHWNTKDEQAMKQYTVERSTNGVSFTAIGTVQAKEQSANDYTLTDADKNYGKLYYRIKAQTDNGAVTYSKIIAVNPMQYQVNIFTNPVTDVLNIVIAGNEKGIVQLYGAGGQLVLSRQVTGGTNKVDVHSLPGGIYTFVLQLGTKRATKQLVKQ